jgi:hypothetical protein
MKTSYLIRNHSFNDESKKETVEIYEAIEVIRKMEKENREE